MKTLQKSHSPVMELLHYSEQPFEFDQGLVYQQPKDGYHNGKPRGLWVSVKGPDDWEDWCRKEGWCLEGLGHVSQIQLSNSANILLVDTEEKLAAFNAEYGNGDDLDMRSINWKPVIAKYDGIIIAPYQWGARLPLMWYYCWDCASGVIWNLAAVAAVLPVSGSPEGERVLSQAT